MRVRTHACSIRCTRTHAPSHACAQALSGSWDATLKLWDLRERRCVATLQGHGDGVSAVTADFGVRPREVTRFADVLMALAETMVVRHYKNMDVAMREGDMGDFMGFVVEGELTVCHRGAGRLGAGNCGQP